MCRKAVETSIDSQRNLLAEDWCRLGNSEESSRRIVRLRAFPWWAMYGLRRQPKRCAKPLVQALTIHLSRSTDDQIGKIGREIKEDGEYVRGPYLVANLNNVGRSIQNSNLIETLSLRHSDSGPRSMDQLVS